MPWLIIVLVPAMVVFLVRLSRQYATEAEQLEHDVPVALAEPVLRRHVILVFVDHLDLAAAQAIQYGRSLQPDELRAVHFVIDQHAAEALTDAWVEHGLTRIALDLVDCPDRRISRTAVETVARDLADGVTEVSVVLPERKYRGIWHRILHDQTADAIVKGVSLLPHANVTTVPFHFASKHVAKPPERAAAGAPAATEDDGSTPVPPRADGTIPISSVRWRRPVVVAGRVRTVRVQPVAGTATLEVVIEDETGAISAVFSGRSRVGGIGVGTRVRVAGTAGRHRTRLAILNPSYELLGRAELDH